MIIPEEANIVSQLCLHEVHLLLRVHVIRTTQTRRRALQLVLCLELKAGLSDLVNTLLHHGASYRRYVEKEAEEPFQGRLWAHLEVFEANPVGRDLLSYLVPDYLVVQLQILREGVDKTAPEVGKVAMILLLSHKAVAVEQVQVGERGEDIDRIARDGNHFVCSEGTTIAHGHRVMRLGDPDAVVIAGEVLPEHAKRDSLMENMLDSHFRPRPDARDLLEVSAQECVATSNK